MPTIASVPDGYEGLPHRHRSANDEDFMASLFDDPVPVWEEVLGERTDSAAAPGSGVETVDGSGAAPSRGDVCYDRGARDVSAVSR
jgi:hypothetical protein